MEFKGTKGEWKNVVIDISDFKQVVVGVDKGKAVCHLWFEYSEGISDEIKANALLISKAPEMLEMLKELVNIYPIVIEEDKEILHKCKKLIKEATEL
jgi:hypothetical protein